MTFEPVYPWAIVYPCHPTNRYDFLTRPGAPGVPAKPKAIVIHTPEEDADNYPGTPAWFATYHANPDQRGSTYYFVSYQLDERRPGFTKVYRCVDERDAAIANGLNGKPAPAWATPGVSLNWQTDNVEVEGRAATIHQTLNVGEQGVAQFRTLVDLCKFSASRHGYQLDREHVIGHYQLSIDRTDPGPNFPWSELMAAFEEDVMERWNGVSAWYGDAAHQTFLGTVGINATLDFKLPPSATEIELEIFIAGDSGGVKLHDGGGKGVPGKYAFQVPQVYGHGRVKLSDPDDRGYRWCYMSSIGAQTVKLRDVGVGIVGYW